jgi:hypothetical protein
MNGDSKGHDDLVRQSHLLWSRLLQTVEELDHRRHEAFDFRAQIERHLRGLVVVGGVLLVTTVGAVAVGANRVATAAERRRRNRWRLARRVWRRPESALWRRRYSIFAELARSLLLAIATAVATWRGRRFVTQLVRGESTPTRQPRTRHARHGSHGPGDGSDFGGIEPPPR